MALDISWNGVARVRRRSGQRAAAAGAGLPRSAQCDRLWLLAHLQAKSEEMAAVVRRCFLSRPTRSFWALVETPVQQCHHLVHHLLFQCFRAGVRQLYCHGRHHETQLCGEERVVLRQRTTQEFEAAAEHVVGGSL